MIYERFRKIDQTFCMKTAAYFPFDCLCTKKSHVTWHFGLQFVCKPKSVITYSFQKPANSMTKKEKEGRRWGGGERKILNQFETCFQVSRPHGSTFFSPPSLSASKVMDILNDNGRCHKHQIDLL